MKRYLRLAWRGGRNYPHDVRKTLATMLWQIDPAAAQLTLGHTRPSTTRRHYVAKGGIVSMALERVPEPESFGG